MICREHAKRTCNVPLPQKNWFKIHEIAARWSVPLSDIEAYALDEMLQLCVYVARLPAESGILEASSEGRFPVTEDLPILNGPQPLRQESLLTIFRDGQAHVRAFRTANSYTYLHVAERAQPVVVRLDDLIMTRQERDRFEREHGFLSTAGSAWHNENYTSVRVDGTWHSLGPKQAMVIKFLKDASESPEPWCDGKHLLSEVGSSLLRMVDLFKRKPVWRRLITADGKGRYRLSTEFATPQSQKIRLFRRASHEPYRPARTSRLAA